MRLVVAAVLLVGLIAAVYGVTLGFGLVFDDQILVVENPYVRLPLSSGLDLLRPAGPGIAYRPVRTFSYMVDHAFGGGIRPAVFHASNLIHHAAASLGLFVLARLLIGSTAGALGAAAVFAVHPLNSESVAYVSGRRDLLAALLAIVALLCWQAGLPAHDRGRRLLAVLGTVFFAVLAVGAKESAIVLPLLALLLLVKHHAGAGGVGRSNALAGVLLLAAGLVLVAFWELYGPVLGRTLREWRPQALAPQPAFSLRVFGQYLLLSLWPVRLLADYTAHAFPLPQSRFDAPAVVAGLALIALLVGGVALLRRGSAAGVGLLWFVVALLPVAQIVPYREVLAEHNAYLPLAGLALAAGAAIAAGAGSRPRLVLGLTAGVVLAFGVRAHLRALDWRDNLTLWTKTVATAPACIRAQYNLGLAQMARGRFGEARTSLERALALDGNDRDVVVALASLCGRLGDSRRALELARRAAGEHADYQALTMLGWAQLDTGDAAGAVASFETAVGLASDPVEARRGLALARSRTGRF
jgi:tetratricopeptide (TPR) repeat protein